MDKPTNADKIYDLLNALESLDRAKQPKLADIVFKELKDTISNLKTTDDLLKKEQSEQTKELLNE